MEEKDMKDIFKGMNIINTQNLVFAKIPSNSPDGFFVNVFLKNDTNNEEPYGMLMFANGDKPKVTVFRNEFYDDKVQYQSEVDLYITHVIDTSGVSYDRPKRSTMDFGGKMSYTMEVEGVFTKQVVDDNGKPVFNEDGTPKMYDKPFSIKQ